MSNDDRGVKDIAELTQHLHDGYRMGDAGNGTCDGLVTLSFEIVHARLEYTHDVTLPMLQPIYEARVSGQGLGSSHGQLLDV
jgi:hypothetical protein